MSRPNATNSPSDRASSCGLRLIDVSAWKIAPALATGNTVILKPAAFQAMLESAAALKR